MSACFVIMRLIASSAKTCCRHCSECVDWLWFGIILWFRFVVILCLVIIFILVRILLEVSLLFESDLRLVLIWWATLYLSALIAKLWAVVIPCSLICVLSSGVKHLIIWFMMTISYKSSYVSCLSSDFNHLVKLASVLCFNSMNVSFSFILREWNSSWCRWWHNIWLEAQI